MRSSELLIIYLAIAAPRGVALFLQRSSGEHVFKRGVKALGTSLLWPLLWRRHVACARNRNRHLLTSLATEEQAVDEAISIKIELATRTLLTAFDEVYESTRAFQDEQQSALAVYECRCIVETYVGLTRFAAAATTSLFPSTRETEMARLGGRRGDDLQLAGLCTQRRNAARLFAHTESSRAKFLKLLSDLKSGIPKVYSNSPADKREAEGALPENILRVYGHAINLASLLEDTETTLYIANMLDAECACLPALGTGATKESQLFSPGEKTCLTTYVTRTSSTGRLPNKTYTQA